MKEGWEYKKLKEVGLTQTGTTPSKQIKSFYGGDIPFIRPAELNIDQNGGILYESELKLTEEGALKARVIKENSVLMCCIGSVGKTGFTLRSVTCNQQINTITPYDNYNPKFVYYALISPSFQQEVTKIANSAKATLPIISKGKWEVLSIPIPPLSEQQSIVDYLDSAFTKIDTLKANAEKALNEAKALFQASLKEMLEPKEDWKYKKLGEVCEILDSRRKPITKNKREPGTIPYYGATGILDYVKDYIFDEKLVLLGEDGAKWGAGENSAYIIEGKTWVNNHAHALRPKRELLVDELLVYYLNFANLQPFITGVTVPKLNQEKMRSIEIPVPPISDQQSIVTTLDSLKSKVDRLQENYDKISQECDALKQAILRQVFE